MSHQIHNNARRHGEYIAPDHRHWYRIGFNRGLMLGTGIGLWALAVYVFATWRHLT